MSHFLIVAMGEPDAFVIDITGAAKVTDEHGASFTAYELTVDDGPIVLRRYSAFVALKDYLSAKFPEQKKNLGEGFPSDSLGGAFAKVTGGLGEESVVTIRYEFFVLFFEMYFNQIVSFSETS